jgi:flagellar hook-basal body complex protein FliE
MSLPIGGAASVQSGVLRAVGQNPGIDWRRLELGGAQAGPSFGDALKDALNEVSAMQDGARDAIGAFMRGEPVELHEVMAATEEAGIALELLIEIRNKLTDAYRAVINMQS